MASATAKADPFGMTTRKATAKAMASASASATANADSLRE
jgi:hypothetical protein